MLMVSVKSISVLYDFLIKGVEYIVGLVFDVGLILFVIESILVIYVFMCMLI